MKRMTKLRRAALPTVALLAMALAPAWVLADGGGGGGSSGSGGSRSSAADPQYNAAVSAIKAQDYAKAIDLLQGYVARSPEDANGENWLAYSYRKSGQLDAAFEHYDKALKIDPKHLGAHEYMGEAYLMVGNLAKAEEHLKILDKLCFLPCEQFTDLKEAVAAYKVNKGIASSTK